MGLVNAIQSEITVSIFNTSQIFDFENRDRSKSEAVITDVGFQLKKQLECKRRGDGLKLSDGVERLLPIRKATCCTSD